MFGSSPYLEELMFLLMILPITLGMITLLFPRPLARLWVKVSLPSGRGNSTSLFLGGGYMAPLLLQEMDAWGRWGLKIAAILVVVGVLLILKGAVLGRASVPTGAAQGAQSEAGSNWITTVVIFLIVVAIAGAVIPNPFDNTYTSLLGGLIGSIFGDVPQG